MRRRDRRPRAGVLPALWLLPLLLVLLVPGRSTLAPWTDPAPPSATSSLSSVQMVTPVITCTQLGLTSVRLGWPAQTSPTTVTWVATAGGQVLPGLSGTSIDVTGSLLSSLGLLGGSRTVMVTGTLPGTTWTTATPGTVVLSTVVVGLLVTCPA